MNKCKILSTMIIIMTVATACNKQPDTSETSEDLLTQSETTDTVISENEDTTATETDPVIERTLESIEEAWNSRLEIDEPEMPVIGFKLTEGRFVGYVEKGSDKLSDVIKAYDTSLPRFVRLDNRVISLLGGASYTTDGDEITASSAICNLDAYRSVLEELITEKYDKYSEDTTLPNSKEEIIELFSDPSNLNCDLWVDYMRLSYVFEDTNIDDFVIVLPYEEYADIISPELLPGEGTSVVTSLSDGLPCEYYPEGVETDNMDTYCFNTFNVNNYNGRDYTCSVVDYNRVGGDIDTPDDYYTNYHYVLIFDITEGKGENAKLVYEKEYEERPEYYYYVDFVNDIESQPNPEIPQISFSNDVSADMISVEGEGYENLDAAVSTVEQELFDEITSENPIINYSLKRCDVRVLSLVGSGNDLKIVGLNFDVSGNRLNLKDIMNDYDGFTAFFNDYIETDYIKTVDTVLSTQYIELDSIPELDELNDSDSWFMDADSLVFCYQNSNDRNLYIHIPYSSITRYMKSDYLPDNRSVIASFSMGPLETIEGKVIEFTAMDADCCDANYLTIDGATIGTIPNGFVGGPCRFYRTDDDSEYLVLQMYLDLESDKSEDLVYVIDLTGDDWSSVQKVTELYVEGFQMPNTLAQLMEIME